MEELNIEYNRYVHYFDKEITRDSVQELIDVLVGVPSCDLYITTPGGECTSSQVLIHFINNHPDIKVYLTGYIASAGADFLTDCTQEVYLTEQLDWILFHQGDREFGGKFRKALLDKDILFQQLKEENDKYAEKYKKLGLNSKEIKSYFKGEDVILYRKDFNRLKVSKK
jgi:ATP-dependent protease ClpP protease subunit